MVSIIGLRGVKQLALIVTPVGGGQWGDHIAPMPPSSRMAGQIRKEVKRERKNFCKVPKRGGGGAKPV